MRYLWIRITFSLLISRAWASDNQDEVKSYETARTPSAITIDGLGDDPAWNEVEWSGEFTQREPTQGEAPSEQTAFKILYDDKNLYVLIRAFDSEPDKIVKRMSRRDGFVGDWVEISIDSYHDKRTAFSFTATASGVKGDEYVTNNGDSWDEKWNPVWYLKTSMDDMGWLAEYQIPLSQLRFADKPEHTWGLQLQRRFFRNQELSHWVYAPPDAPGYVHRFGELRGLKGIKPQKQVEIQPYVVASTEHFEKEEGNPFATGKASDIRAGLDGKIGITSDITLDFTVNPDFGQVEADPSQVNLGAFQVFFREQRPFFLEGNNILNFQVTEAEAGGSFGNDNLFYSRRIGRSPQFSPDKQDNEFVREPNNTRIVGAAKLTGKNKNGFSWGLLESVTRREDAEIDAAGKRRPMTVEPLTNYLVGRVQQDINDGNTVIGGMITSTNRKINHEQLEFLHKGAVTGGLDFTHRWKERKYYVTLNTVFSTVKGTAESITRTQTSSERYFQRPGQNHNRLDSTRTSLTGSGGTFNFGKSAGNIIYQTGVTYRSPQLDLNDAGFLRNTDFINQYGWIQYRILKPFSIFRWMRLNFNEYLNWDFGGVSTYKAINTNYHLNFKNFWRMGTGVTGIANQISNADLRGGPSFILPGGINQWYYIGTDDRKRLNVRINHWNFWGFEGWNRGQGFWMQFNYRPIDAFNISVEPNASFNDNEVQYVETPELGTASDNPIILGEVNQNTYSLSLRFTYNFNPNLSLQYWGQPFISKGEYQDFKRVTNSLDSDYTARFDLITNDQIVHDSENEEYAVDENNDGITDYSFDDPDFNFVQFRSNMVLRWEYIPGSTLFLVWTQNRTQDISIQDSNSFGSLNSRLFDSTAHNIFLLKFTYRFRL